MTRPRAPALHHRCTRYRRTLRIEAANGAGQEAHLGHAGLVGGGGGGDREAEHVRILAPCVVLSSTIACDMHRAPHGEHATRSRRRIRCASAFARVDGGATRAMLSGGSRVPVYTGCLRVVLREERCERRQLADTGGAFFIFRTRDTPTSPIPVPSMRAHAAATMTRLVGGSGCNDRIPAGRVTARSSVERRRVCAFRAGPAPPQG